MQLNIALKTIKLLLTNKENNENIKKHQNRKKSSKRKDITGIPWSGIPVKM